jgi:predicted neutral ceramidase superfamily lipid hydrolase
VTTIILLTIQHKYIEREEGGGAIMSPNDLSFLHSFPTSFMYQFSSLFLPSHFSFTSLPSLVFPYFFSLVFHLLRWFLNSALSFIPSFYPRSLDWGVLIIVVYILVMLSHLHGLTSQNGSDHKSSDFISLFQLHILHTDKYYIVYLYYFNYMITYPSTACNTYWRDM